MMTDKNFVLCVLNDLEDIADLKLTLEGDKIRTSRKPDPSERAFIAHYRDLIVQELPKRTKRTKADDAPFLQEWFEKTANTYRKRGTL